VASLARRQINILHRQDFHLNDGILKEGASMTVRQAEWRCTSGACCVVAVKALREGTGRSSEQMLADMLFEIQVMAHKPLCSHRNVMTLLGVTFDHQFENQVTGENFKPMAVVPWADEGTLATYCNRMTAINHEMAATLVSDVADGLQALHLYDIVHADVKPENILLFKDANTPVGMIAKLSDFGFCASEQDEIDVKGRTRGWAAPEVLSAAASSIDARADTFSLGQLAMLLASNGEWAPWKVDDGESIAELLLRSNDSLVKYWAQQPQSLERWSWLLANTIVEEPSGRLRSYELGNVRKRLLDE